MPAKQNLPKGKGQFGVVIPIELHKAAVAMANEQGERFSTIYADGIRALIRARQQRGEPAGAGGSEVSDFAQRINGTMIDGGASEVSELTRKLTEGVDKKDWVYLEALADFLRNDPDTHNFGILKLILGNHLPAETAKATRHKRQA